MLQDAGDALSSSMWRHISARTKRSGLQWRFAYALQHLKVTAGKPSRVLLPLSPGFLTFKPSPKTQRKVREACWAIFSSTQMDLIESLFVSMGEPDPWGSIINPSWAAHLLDVEEAWDRATEPYPGLTSGELSSSPQL